MTFIYIYIYIFFLKQVYLNKLRKTMEFFTKKKSLLFTQKNSMQLLFLFFTRANFPVGSCETVKVTLVWILDQLGLGQLLQHQAVVQCTVTHKQKKKKHFKPKKIPNQ